MIRIPVSVSEINERLAAIRRWANNVDQRRQANIAAGRHAGPANGDIWSAAKTLFIQAQLKKCCYCERRLGEYAIDWDVEHYRPKGAVNIWPPPERFSFRFKDKAAPADHGYYLLAYDPLNYLGACKVCNSTFKKSYFPVRRRRRMKTSQPGELAKEEPLLINPIHDDDPEQLIYFLGPTPKPRAQDGDLFQRAHVTIELLGLARGDLIRERSLKLIFAWQFWTAGNHAALDFLCRADMEHASCMRSYRRLCATDEPAAKAIFDEAALFAGFPGDSPMP